MGKASSRHPVRRTPTPKPQQTERGSYENVVATDHPTLGALRETADALEGVVADDLWPLPAYQEMLFMR